VVRRVIDYRVLAECRRYGLICNDATVVGNCSNFKAPHGRVIYSEMDSLYGMYVQNFFGI